MCIRDSLNLKRFFAAGGRLSAEELQRIVRTLAGLTEATGTRTLAAAAGVSLAKTSSAVARLEDEGVVERSADGLISLTRRSDNLGAHLVSAVEAQRDLREAHRARIEPIRHFARTRDCRRALLLGYFGDRPGQPCSGCDNCDLERGHQPVA